MNKKFRYIYNKFQKDFYLRNGAKLVNVGVHPNTKNNYWVFAEEDVKNLFILWCELCKHRKQ